ncbi:MAG: NTP transferase domain-containing protein [Planctomycetota bacterium]
MKNAKAPKSAPGALVILAAGASERLGACKALVELGRALDGSVATPLALLTARGRAAWDGARPLVVAGKHHAAIAAALPADVECVENLAWARGRTGGIALAAARRAGCDLCLAPVDVPLVSAEVFRALRAVWIAEGAPARGFLAPACSTGPRPGRRFGHPIVVGRELALELARFEPDQPLSELRALARPLLAVDVEDPSVLDDLDDASDLERLRAKFAP